MNTFSYFIESKILSVACREPLAAKTREQAKAEAERLLSRRPGGYAVHVFSDGERLLTIRRASASTDRRN